MKQGPRERQDALSVIENQILSQPASLSSYLRTKSVGGTPDSLFVGAGDSYAASCIASHLSSMRHLALEPYDLVSAPRLAKNRSVYFVSASGMTTSNVEAARAVEGVAKERVAITSNPRGRLTDVVDKVIFIPCKSIPRVPGTLSFSLSLLALLRLSAPRLECDFGNAHSRARRDASKILHSSGGTTHFLGAGAAFPICVYSALKVYELLGARAQAWMLEEFGHAGLFSLRKSDVVNVSCGFDPRRLGRRLAAALRRNGFNAVAVAPFGSNPLEQVFYSIFLSQFAALQQARAAGLSQPYLVGAKAKLSVSDSLIY